ncbi:hypothetical protein [Mycolicibacterium vaccae]|uniref:hypothetical protein n=1 Tax=Mycolicibacterium vaccae TaxID=1810 RepID=UPI003D0357E8
MAKRLRAVTLGVLLMLTACQQQPQDDTEVTASRPAMEVRHDTEPLAAAFPALGEPVSASWIEWDNSAASEEPSRTKVVWIDAVVEIKPETMTDLVDDNFTELAGQRPAVQKVLEPFLPPGPFRTGVDLNIIFGANQASTRAFLDEQHNTVVLQSYRMDRLP